MAKKCLRFHVTVKIVSDYQSITKYAVAASRQFAPEVIMVMFMSPLDAPHPRRGFSATWSLLMFISMQCAPPPPVRVKTFSTHVVVKICHVVRKMAGFTHGMSNIGPNTNPASEFSTKSAIFTI